MLLFTQNKKVLRKSLVDVIFQSFVQELDHQWVEIKKMPSLTLADVTFQSFAQVLVQAWEESH